MQKRLLRQYLHIPLRPHHAAPPQAPDRTNLPKWSLTPGEMAHSQSFVNETHSRDLGDISELGSIGSGRDPILLLVPPRNGGGVIGEAVLTIRGLRVSCSAVPETYAWLLVALHLHARHLVVGLRTCGT